MRNDPLHVYVAAYISAQLLGVPTGKLGEALLDQLGSVQGAGALCIAGGLGIGVWLHRSDRRVRLPILLMLALMFLGSELWALGGGAWQVVGPDTTTFAIIYALAGVFTLKAVALMLYASWEAPRNVLERWRAQGHIA